MARILVIDDESAMRGVLREALERAGHWVLEADGGDAGLDLYRSAPVDLVITDIFMPGKDGYATIEAFRAEFPGAKLLVISGAGGLDDPGHYLSLAKRLGANAALGKPLAMAELVKTVAQLTAGAEG